MVTHGAFTLDDPEQILEVVPWTKVEAVKERLARHLGHDGRHRHPLTHIILRKIMCA